MIWIGLVIAIASAVLAMLSGIWGPFTPKGTTAAVLSITLVATGWFIDYKLSEQSAKKQEQIHEAQLGLAEKDLSELIALVQFAFKDDGPISFYWQGFTGEMSEEGYLERYTLPATPEELVQDPAKWVNLKLFIERKKLELAGVELPDSWRSR